MLLLLQYVSSLIETKHMAYIIYATCFVSIDEATYFKKNDDVIVIVAKFFIIS